MFTLLCGVSKGFMKAFKAFIKPFEIPQRSVKAFIKPFETPQRSVKIKIQLNFFPSSGIGTGRANKYNCSLLQAFKCRRYREDWWSDQ